MGKILSTEQQEKILSALKGSEYRVDGMRYKITSWTRNRNTRCHNVRMGLWDRGRFLRTYDAHFWQSAVGFDTEDPILDIILRGLEKTYS